MSDKNVTPQPGPAPDCGEMRKEKKKKALTLEEMKEMHIGASHEQPPEGAETSGMVPLPEVEFIENVGKAVSGVMDMAVSAVESAEKFLNDCACEVSSWDWGLFDHLLDVARGYSGEGGEFSGDKLVGAIAKGGMGFVFGTVKGLLNMVGHPVETAKGIGHAVTHPKELLNGLKEQYWGNRKNWAEKVSGVTEAVCDIAFLLYGAKKGFNKLSKGSKTGETVAKAGEAGEIAEEVAKVEEVAEEAAKAGEVGEEVAKAGEVAEDAAKAGEKAGGKGEVRIESSNKSFKFSEMTENEIAKIVEEYRKKAPIEIPDTAKCKAKSMADGYEQISYKWNDGTYKYEARWHTRTSGAPKGQGNTWVIQRTIPGNGGTKPSTQFLIGENEWVEGWKWYDAIKARKNGTATQEQIELLDKGHWKE